MTETASRVLSVLQAHPASPAWRLAKVGMPVTIVGFALRELERAGLARRGRDNLGIVVWFPTDGGAA